MCVPSFPSEEIARVDEGNVIIGDFQPPPVRVVAAVALQPVPEPIIRIVPHPDPEREAERNRQREQFAQLGVVFYEDLAPVGDVVPVINGQEPGDNTLPPTNQ